MTDGAYFIRNPTYGCLNEKFSSTTGANGYRTIYETTGACQLKYKTQRWPGGEVSMLLGSASQQYGSTTIYKPGVLIASTAGVLHRSFFPRESLGGSCAPMAASSRSASQGWCGRAKLTG